ncbi:centromere protein N-like [Lineus longissimus]|uniref:centromere protein N-like n=1 Tax=Lineus longissimus TaxID=88925 RepID=UPI002B4C607E
MVYYPHTDYVLLTAIKQAHRRAILQALQVAIGCSEVTEMKLSGKSVTSLLQLALNKDSQGSFSKFRLNQVDANPLSVRQRQKRKVPDEDDDALIHITDENIVQKRRRIDILLDVFGPNEQPQLEKVEFRLDTKFRGLKHAPGMRERTDPFRCRVKFEGVSVLKGIREMADRGILDSKMPAHLRNLHSMGKNQITLAEKDEDEGTPQK